jgi:hypothetical protein
MEPDHGGSYGDPYGGQGGEQLSELIALTRKQTAVLEALLAERAVDRCTVEQIGRILCMTVNESHRMAQSLDEIRRAVAALLALEEAVHPEQTLQLQRLADLQRRVDECCPPADADDCHEICRFEPCRPHGAGGDGWSMKTRGYVNPVQVPEEHEPWEIVDRPHHEDDDQLPTVPLGPFVGLITPSSATPQPMDFRSGSAPAPGSQSPVGFRTYTETALAANWPPDMSGARGGDVVLMSGNLWLKLSLDGGQSFTDLDFTKIFAKETTYGGWAGDQVIHYIPAIDCFVLYVQSFKGTNGNANKNVVKVALASQADLKTYKGGKQAWRRQWDFTSDTFGLGASWMDFPDITWGQNYLHINTNVLAGKPGKLFFELPLADMVAGRGLSFLYGFVDDKTIQCGSPAQNVLGDQFYWAAHKGNSKMVIFSSKGGDANYDWRERDVRNWPKTSDNDIIAKAPDSDDWISEDHRIIGATRMASELWFAWTAASGDGGYGGFKFPFPHVQVVKFDLTQDFKLLDQMQIWNADHAYAYPSMTTNSDNEVGISLAWGGGTYYGSHAVGILGDFVVWYGDKSDATVLRDKVDDSGNIVKDAKGNPIADKTRFGDYVHVRLAHPDTRFFGAFGYSVKADPAIAAPERGKFQYAYVEFGRQVVPPSGLH